MMAAHDESPASSRTLGRAAGATRLLIVSNRLPVTVHRKGSIVELHDSVGGLATGLRGPHAESNGWWIGWPGDLASLDAAQREKIDNQLGNARTVPIAMSASEVELFYE